MNIFQRLGLAPDHRAESKVTQLVKHYDEVIQKHKDDKKYGIQLKEDGVCAITVILDGMAAIYSRTGRKFTNTSQLCHDLTERQLPNGVYFGELVCSLVSLEVLSGVVNPNRVNPLSEAQIEVAVNLRMRFFDLISVHSFIKGHSDTEFIIRYNNLVERIGPSERTDVISVINLIPVVSESQIDKFLDLAVEQGEEGLVIIDLYANWEAGHKGWRKMKKVRGCDYDLLCIGYEEGTGKYKGKVANLIFRWKGGKTVKAMLGKGWTHELAENMFDAINYVKKDGDVGLLRTVSNTLKPVGKIFQVYALEESSQGKLRLPKVGEQRFDKTNPDI